ncbi:MAG: Unknown protein [uncultured Campylobacterales bacterium]|uniref:Uncharacterized protein n=1 Tax=uncultured Campylobacterales bacterium TaxID=352960 RepID=A0A6S6SII5_9BACT|nr:MAG: Unknown protein [uncultured Campylobacterales bacterium]
MNYEDKINSMKERGILNNSEAKEFKSSLKTTPKQDHKQKIDYTKFILIGLITLIVISLFFLLNNSQNSNTIQNISNTLNTNDVGYISEFNVLLIVLVFISCCVIIGAYMFMIISSNLLKNLQEKINQFNMNLSNATAYKDNVHSLLNETINKVTSHEKDIFLNNPKEVNALLDTQPELKSNQNFIYLQNELLNAIDYEENTKYQRNVYIQKYNAKISKFPISLLKNFTRISY